MRRKPASALGQGARMAASLPIESGGWWKCAWGRYNASRARNDLCGGSSEMQGVATYTAALIEPNLAVCRARLDKLLRFCQAFDPSSSVVRRGVPRRLTAQVELDDVFGGRQLQGQPAGDQEAVGIVRVTDADVPIFPCTRRSSMAGPAETQVRIRLGGWREQDSAIGIHQSGVARHEYLEREGAPFKLERSSTNGGDRRVVRIGRGAVGPRLAGSILPRGRSGVDRPF